MPRKYDKLNKGKAFKPQSAFGIFGDSISQYFGLSEKRSVRKPKPDSRSITPKAITDYETAYGDVKLTDVETSFFDVVFGTSPRSPPKFVDPEVDPRTLVRPASYPSARKARSNKVQPADGVRAAGPPAPVKPARGFTVYSRHRKDDKEPLVAAAARPGAARDEPDLSGFLEGAYDNSSRHAIGMKILSKIFGSGKITGLKEYEEDRTDRPFFTYWLTLVQIIIYIIVAATYGFAPYGVAPKETTGQILMTSLAISEEVFQDQTNMWLGPRQEDLIHVGSRFGPCMRPDTTIKSIISNYKQKENETACCINKDGSGCVQSSSTDCTDYLSVWKSWRNASKPTNDGVVRRSGSVCGQDPDYCLQPESSPPDVWSDDISKWPICLRKSNITKVGSDIHMGCEVIGRPCCIGLQGLCVMATREYCNFRRGHFHEEATLCSQVSCLNDVCGMIPFRNPDTPDQIYRLVSNMFLHAGLLDIIITIVLQLLFMRELEKLISTWRVVIIYLGSGICGSLASAIFMPYFVETGPSGAQFGIIAAMGLELVRYEHLYYESNPPEYSQFKYTLIKLGSVLLGLLIIGLILPQIDNYAHSFGFIFGLFLAFGLRPIEDMCDFDFRKNPADRPFKIAIMVACILSAGAMLIILLLVFFLVDSFNCQNCAYFNCIPFTSHYCDNVKISYEIPH